MLLVILLPLTASGQEASRDFKGNPFCAGTGAALYQDGKGGTSAMFTLRFAPDADHAVYPEGGAKLFAPPQRIAGSVSVTYRFGIGTNGNPTSRPAPTNIAVSAGSFSGPRPQPLDATTLQLAAGDIVSMPIRPINLEMNVVFNGELVAPGYVNSGAETEAPVPDLVRLMMAFESRDRWIVVSHQGKEAARIPIPQRSVVAERDSAIAWIRRTVPLLAAGKCG
jgi:hypothetical protein